MYEHKYQDSKYHYITHSCMSNSDTQTQRQSERKREREHFKVGTCNKILRGKLASFNCPIWSVCHNSIWRHMRTTRILTKSGRALPQQTYIEWDLCCKNYGHWIVHENAHDLDHWQNDPKIYRCSPHLIYYPYFKSEVKRSRVNLALEKGM